VLGSIVQRRGTIHPGSFIGKGKVEEVKQAAEDRKADVVIFNDDLSPPQVRNLEKALAVKVVDRSELILDIFAKRARTRESRLQVELSQLEYTMPRLTGMWKHLERQAGGIGTRGPGETQLEVDRRRVRERIAVLKKQLQAVERGYTNAGKSTLFNALTRASVFVEDRLFATLDATTRQMVSPRRETVLLTDTVGFIRKLPHHLVASFRSTLSEVVEADILLHVIDAADPDFRRQMEAVEAVLEEILEEPRPRVLVFNKADALGDPLIADGLHAEFPGCHVVSARSGQGLSALRTFLWAQGTAAGVLVEDGVPAPTRSHP
jgi:GTP-binding protein HflX